MRAGYLARWQGSEYEAFPAPTPEGLWIRLYTDRPEPGFDRVREGRYRRVVLPSALEQLAYVRPVAMWRDQPFLLRSREGGRAHLEYTGGNAAVAARLGCTRVERGVYEIRVPSDELTGIRTETVLIIDAGPDRSSDSRSE
ncbi:hypothetical protein [Cryptosporangium aurantiacum]|uniref:Uncharacterized protein n=1 Tax=Cryptosporangium aurantiacum TaxID=134849 RepID=A0A1M7NI97_9ACTN|nr:hypothetical protein [Cryptosporangium aurantiacum]SHN03523.1 hypothetical protein SAMN05443668_102651 [Cryptosporangium aurantiacum]